MDISHVPFEVAFEVVVANVACCVTFHVKVRFCNGIEFLLAYFALHVSLEVSVKGLH